jgi:hypothetical protein
MPNGHRRVNQDSRNKIKELLTRGRNLVERGREQGAENVAKTSRSGARITYFEKNDFFVCNCEKSL